MLSWALLFFKTKTELQLRFDTYYSIVILVLYEEISIFRVTVETPSHYFCMNRYIKSMAIKKEKWPNY